MYITSVSNASIISVRFCWELWQKERELPPKFYSRRKLWYLPWKSYCLPLNLLGTSCPGATTISSSDSTQPNLTLSSVRHENDLVHPTPPHKLKSAIYQLLLTEFWWNFKHLEQMPTSMLTFVQEICKLTMQQLPWWHLSISGISQLVPTRF